MRHTALALTAFLALVPSTGWADRGAVSVEVGGGMTASFVPAPYVAAAPPLPASFATLRLGARYALTNSLEVVASAFYEPQATLSHNGVTVDTDWSGYTGNERGRGAFPGTLTYGASRVGGTAGVRYYHGMTLRLVAGLEAGWSRRSLSGFHHLDDRTPSNVQDYGLTFNDITSDSLMLAPTAGLEWAGGDTWSISILPRAEVLLERTPVVSFSVPLLFSWSWYL